MTSFTGKAVIVTGASSGIGRSVAIELARAGADLWLVGRSADELAITAQMIADAGGPAATSVPLDLRSRGGLSKLVADVAAQHPHLFALVNNAGLMHPEPIMQGTVDRWQAMLDVNVMATLEGAKAAVEAMRAHGKPGHILNVGSVAGRWEEPGVYGASKKMVESIGASLRQETERDDIRVTTIIPGGFATQLARGFDPEQLAAVAGSFERLGIANDARSLAKVIGDPQHIAKVIRYVLEQPIEINFQEILIRPPIDTKV